ncbi:DUF7511 domain-containing protein [Natrinema longum]|uniref:DUF7511 domain-containing protein n=1 Tax=Natrinema longum TaxID=370324 RepID=A0A8A2UB09_9EURY|nr:hypothetical protein [Natrinema longum]MBZ6496274.1 hypothetical protein [Natrinema longum]QSW85807.1 hypothetical protein J0X27_02935 [Natrinema longum]
MSHSSRDTCDRDSETDHAAGLQHVTVERAGIAVCTIFPRAVGEDATSTQWIAATADSFVALEGSR